MPKNLKRMTFIVTPEMDSLLDEMKKDYFYNRSKSDMIRVLIGCGLNTLKKTFSMKRVLNSENDGRQS